MSFMLAPRNMKSLVAAREASFVKARMSMESLKGIFSVRNNVFGATCLVALGLDPKLGVVGFATPRASGAEGWPVRGPGRYQAAN